MQIAALSNLDLKLTLSEIQFDPFSYELISMSAVFILLVDSCVAMPGHRNSSTMRLIGFCQNNCSYKTATCFTASLLFQVVHFLPNEWKLEKLPHFFIYIKKLAPLHSVL